VEIDFDEGFAESDKAPMVAEEADVERSEPKVRDGKMWHCRATGGRPGRAMLAVWLEEIVVPLGMRTWMGADTGWTLLTGALVIT
jgi:hypothetical protein